MMKIYLTSELKSALEWRHSKVRYGYVRAPIKAILLHSKSWTIIMIIQDLLVHGGTISRHIKDFIEEQKFIPKNGGSLNQLNNEQTK